MLILFKLWGVSLHNGSRDLKHFAIDSCKVLYSACIRSHCCVEDGGCEMNWCGVYSI
jgi:hypothetical protein